MVVTHFGLVDVVEEKLYIIPRVVMASDDAVLARFFFYDNPEYKRHPTYTKTDQLPISEVITGPPRPYHHTGTRHFSAVVVAVLLRSAQNPDACNGTQL